MNSSTPIPDSIASLGRWGYYASVSFTDYNVGVVLDALEEQVCVCVCPICVCV